jgi:hypothetical protein
MALEFEKPSSNLHVYNIEKKGLEVPFKRTGPTLVNTLSHKVSGWEWKG